MIARCVRFGAASAILVHLAGCGGQDASSQAKERTATAPVSVSAASGGAAARASSTAVPEPQSAPDYAALGQVQDPARVLAFLGAALHDGRWDDATRAWGENGDAAALERRFGRSGPVTLTFGLGDSEGAAGSIYYSAPYILRRADGAQEKGTIVLRRVNDVPGASRASLRWHVSSMDAVHPTGS